MSLAYCSREIEKMHYNCLDQAFHASQIPAAERGILTSEGPLSDPDLLTALKVSDELTVSQTTLRMTFGSDCNRWCVECRSESDSATTKRSCSRLCHNFARTICHHVFESENRQRLSASKRLDSFS